MIYSQWVWKKQIFLKYHASGIHLQIQCLIKFTLKGNFSPLKTMCVTLKNGNNSFPFQSNLKIWQWHFHAYFKILQIIFTGRNKYNRYWMNQSTLYAFIFLIFNVTISSFLNFQSNMKAIKCLFVKILLLSALSVAIIVTIMNIF